MSPKYYPTCVGQLVISRRTPPYSGNPDGTLVTGSRSVSGNAKQRRRKVRLLKGNGWTVQSMLRVGRTDKVHGRIVYVNR